MPEANKDMNGDSAKNDLITAAKDNYEKLNLLISKMTEEEINTPFDFSNEAVHLDLTL